MEDGKVITVLITGASGSLGTELCRCLDDDNRFRVTALSHSELDITDASAVQKALERTPGDFVVNCAAYTAVDKAESEPDKCMDINVEGVRNIVDAAKKASGRLIHISTDFVFDGKAVSPYVEDAPAAPLSVYGTSKLMAEKIIADTMPESVVIRTGWLYSPTGCNFVKSILKGAADGKRLRVVDDQKGTPTYAADLADVIRRIMIRGYDFPGGIYNFSNAGECTRFEFAEEIIRLAGKNTELTPCKSADYPTPAVRPAYSVLDKSKISTCLGLTIAPWTDGLRRMMERLKPETNDKR